MSSKFSLFLLVAIFFSLADQAKAFRINSPSFSTPPSPYIQESKKACDTVVYLPNLPQLCHNNDPVDLIDETNVFPNTGTWTAYDTALVPAPPNYRKAGPNNEDLNGALVNNIIDPSKTNSSGGVYYLRYKVEATGCPTLIKDTLITVNPVPKPIIDHSPLKVNSQSEPFTFTKTDDTIRLEANPAGGSFTAGQAITVRGADFFPSKAVSGNPFWIYYDYFDLNGCLGGDSVQVQVPTATSITDLNSLSIRISPVPATDEINIDWSMSLVSPGKVSIIDEQGKVCLTTSIPDYTEEIALDISDLNTGSYYVVLEFDNKATQTQILKF